MPIANSDAASGEAPFSLPVYAPLTPEQLAETPAARDLAELWQVMRELGLDPRPDDPPREPCAEVIAFPSLPAETKASPRIPRVRRGPRRARTLSATKRLTRDEKARSLLAVLPPDVARPRTREDCENGPRPCPWVSCQHHLYLDVDPESGALKLNFPDLEPHQIPESCALDVADREGARLEDVAATFGFSRERARQLEVSSLARLRRTPVMQELDESPSKPPAPAPRARRTSGDGRRRVRK